MNNAEEAEYTQPVGLDIGTSRIVVARNADKKYQYESQLNAFLTIPYSKLAESLLQRENVFHEVQGADIVVAGNDAQKFAEVFHVETRRPMANGVLNPHEPHSLAVLRRIVGKLMGPAAAPGQKAFRRVGNVELHGHRNLLRERTLQRVSGGVVSAGAQFRGAEGRRFHRQPGGRGDWRSGYPLARGEGAILPFERTYGRSDGKRVERVLPGGDHQSHGRAADSYFGYPAAAQAGSGDSFGAERRDGAAEGLPGSFFCGVARAGFPGEVVGSKVVGGPFELDG
jgi:hypothetical protein